MMERTVDMMRCDIMENEENYIFDIELPGCEKEKIQAYVEKGYLIVTADLRKENDEKTKYVAKERRAGKFTRRFYVGDIQTPDVRASYKNGILRLVLPKEAYRKAEERRKITIG